jgi:hypothetical protein
MSGPGPRRLIAALSNQNSRSARISYSHGVFFLDSQQRTIEGVRKAKSSTNTLDTRAIEDSVGSNPTIGGEAVNDLLRRL